VTKQSWKALFKGSKPKKDREPERVRLICCARCQAHRVQLTRHPRTGMLLCPTCFAAEDRRP